MENKYVVLNGYWRNIVENKYVVLKSEDYEKLMRNVSPEVAHEFDFMQLDPGSFFVVRGSDAFAPAGVFAYANNIRTYLELRYPGDDVSEVDGPEYHRLSRLADDLMELGHSWRESHGKVPD